MPTKVAHDYLKGTISDGITQHTKELPLKWVYQPNEKPGPQLGTKGIKQVSALTKIAEQMPGKLKRINRPYISTLT